MDTEEFYETDMTMEIPMDESDEIIFRWISVSLALSIFTFLITAFYVYKYRSTKATFIVGGASISALAWLIVNATNIATMLNPEFQTSITSVLYGVRFSFSFYTVFYSFHRLTQNSSKSGKLTVYVGYIFMVVTIAISIAGSVMSATGSYANSETSFLTFEGIMMFIAYSIWGFIAIALLIFFVNKKHLNRKAKFAMIAFIGFNLVSAITSIAISYSNIVSLNLMRGILFFFSELPIQISIIIAAYYASTWIQDHLNKYYTDSQTESNDLEANPPH